MSDGAEPAAEKGPAANGDGASTQDEASADKDKTDDLQLVEVLQHVQTAQKEATEIDRFTVDENLSEIQRAALFLDNMEPIQVHTILERLPALVATGGAAAWSCLSPRLKRVMAAPLPECSLALAESFLQILQDGFVTQQQALDELCPLTLHQVKVAKSPPDIWDAWLRTLQALVPKLDRATLERQVLGFAMGRSSSAGGCDTSKRVQGCRMLGVAIPSISGDDELMPRLITHVKTLCQDLSQDVRQTICEEVVQPMATVLGCEGTLSVLLDEVLELSRDDHPGVRRSAVEALVNILPMIIQKGRDRVMPMLRKFLLPFDLDIVTTRLVARLMAQLPLALVPLTGPDGSAVLSCYHQLAARQDAETRLHCARAFPAVLIASCSGRSVELTAPFTETFCRFVGDAEEGVRVSAAAQLHQLYFHIPTERGREPLSRPFLKLLDDQSHTVLAHVLEKLPVVLGCLGAAASSPGRGLSLDLANTVVKAESRFGHNWRLQLALAQSFTALAEVLPGEQLYDSLLPIAFKYVLGGASAAAVVGPSAEGIVAMFRSLNKEKHRTETLITILRELANGRSFPQRLAFLTVAHAVLRTFSSAFFTAHFLRTCLFLCHDPVPAVRMAVVPLLPDIKRTIQLPAGLDNLERVTGAVSVLLMDADRNVCSMAREMHAAFKAVHVRVQGAGMLDMHGSTKGDSTFEQHDQELQLQEEPFTLNAEELERVQATLESTTKTSGRLTRAGAASEPQTVAKADTASMAGRQAAQSGARARVTRRTDMRTRHNSAGSSASSNTLPDSMPAQGASRNALGTPDDARNGRLRTGGGAVLRQEDGFPGRTPSAGGMTSGREGSLLARNMDASRGATKATAARVPRRSTEQTWGGAGPDERTTKTSSQGGGTNGVTMRQIRSAPPGSKQEDLKLPALGSRRGKVGARGPEALAGSSKAPGSRAMLAGRMR